MKKVLIATEKPFAVVAVEGIKDILGKAGYEVVLLEKYAGSAELQQAVADVDALIVRSDKVTKEVVDAARQLKIVVRAGAGYDNLDLEACTGKGVVAMNTPGQNSNAVAELAIGMMIFMARNQFTPGTGSELKGKNLGIHAYGNVGKLVAVLGKGFGMNVFAFDPFVSEETLKKDGITVITDVKELYRKCHYVSLHIPANDNTKKSIGYDLFSSMPKGGALINTARKEVIDEDGLLKAMMERNDLKYASDIAPDGIAKMEDSVGLRVFATPKKMGAETAEANINAGLAAAQQIVDFFQKKDTRFQVNK
ncbi:MAG: 3-phosphoglycerate dehydrogenase [Bacteroidales bacterium]|jgi:D-3-phosphoglycerate dehydrogenase|nr:3-phosphoglycerate dehydrogenase [Bacteroidales bacterium]